MSDNDVDKVDLHVHVDYYIFSLKIKPQCVFIEIYQTNRRNKRFLKNT